MSSRRPSRTSTRSAASSLLVSLRPDQWTTNLIVFAALIFAREWTGEHDVRIDPSGVKVKPLNPDLCASIRASVLLAGPLLARHGSVTLPPPGGDVIGRRRLDTHFLALERLGADAVGRR